MGRKYKQGFFRALHPEKYKGDPNNIVYRSSWELKLLAFLDINPNVIEYSSEEIVIPYISPKDNRYHRYFPDMLIKVKNIEGKIKTILIEIKPFSQTIPPVKKSRVTKNFITEVLTYAINQAKFEAAQKYCDQRGWIFQIMTEKELGI